MKTLGLFLLLVLTIGLAGCKKEGIGGEASIRGNLYAKHYNSTFTYLLSEYPLADTYVYIIFGDEINYGKRIKTNYDGAFEFEYLYKGDYKIYTYSLDSTAIVNGSVSPPDSAIVVNVQIDKRNEVKDIGTINVFK